MSPTIFPFRQANLQTTDPDGNETTLKVFSDKSLTWEGGVKWLVNCTKLPVIAKGILRADDALMAIEVGCRGVIVSNHGGRNVDTAPATVRLFFGICYRKNNFSSFRSKFYQRLYRRLGEEFR